MDRKVSYITKANTLSIKENQEALMNEPQQIHLREIIAKKFKKHLPRFVVRLFEHIICQDEINFVLREYGHYEGMDFIKKLIYYFGINIKLLGEERLPQDSRVLFVCNHPLGGLDGICLSHIIGSHYQSPIRYIVNDMLLFLHPFRNIFVPVNTLRGQSRESVLKLNAALDSDYPLITFPAGICSRRIEGKIIDLPWKSSFVRQAIKSKRTIVPLYFSGYNSAFFYRIEQVRKQLGIKFNIGTILLPREMFHSKGSSYIVAVGDPISYQSLQDSTKDTKTICEEIRQKVYTLPLEYHLPIR